MRMRAASPAGLLLLALALICAVQTMQAAAYGDGTVKSMPHRRTLKSVYGDQTEPPPTTDPACAALGCEPDGTCEVDQNGERYCKWASPCGACPTGATCKTVPATKNSSLLVPYCACPEGFGMTASECLEGEASTVTSFSYTFISNPTAKDVTSKPYTFRLNATGCTPFPEAVVGKTRGIYFVRNIGDALSCLNSKTFYENNCQGSFMLGSDRTFPGFFAGYTSLPEKLAFGPRSLQCNAGQ